jgi:uncharacterized protein YjbI with pentapeptide repeats
VPFRLPTIKSADFSGAAFRNCRFEQGRFAGCTFGNARFHGCDLFDVRHRQGCSFAFCDMQGVEAEKCNFANNSSSVAGLNLALLADYAGLTISESEQSEILKQLGVEVCG